MSNADKRTVSTDALETLGTIIGPSEQRDAIHLAVLPVIAGERLYPGQPINASKDGVATAAPAGLGIVDPFISGPVHPEQRFWMVLRPRIITSLRHVWSHPAFADEAATHADPASTAKAAAMAELKAIAERCDADVETMIAGANNYLDRGVYLSQGARWESVSVPDEFWPPFEIVTGRKVPVADRDNFFSCSC